MAVFLEEEMKTAAATSAPASEFQLWGPLALPDLAGSQAARVAFLIATAKSFNPKS